MLAALAAHSSIPLNVPYEQLSARHRRVILHGTGGMRGLGRERDRKLNALLLKTLDIFTACFLRLAPASDDAEEVDAWARDERDALFAQLIGILMLARSGRARSIGTDADKVLETSLNALRRRLRSA